MLEPGIATRVGSFEVETLPVPGHRADGLAFRVRSHDVLVVGDYLSSYEPPIINFSSAVFRATLASLIDVLERDAPGLVVPGHRAAHDARAALDVARADLGYLHAIRAAVLAGPAEGDAREAALARGIAVALPRGGDDDDLEVHRDNVARHLDGSSRPELDALARAGGTPNLM